MSPVKQIVIVSGCIASGKARFLGNPVSWAADVKIHMEAKIKVVNIDIFAACFLNLMKFEWIWAQIYQNYFVSVH